MTENFAPTDAQIAKFRLAYNDVDEQNSDEGVGYWYTEIDRTVPEGKGCACGCGLQVRSDKREFQPGHDQRLMGILVFAHRNALEVCWTSGGMLIGGSAEQYGRLVLTDTGVAKLVGYLGREPKRARRSAPAASLASAEVADGGQIPTLGDEAPSIEGAEQITVKIGRWEKEALVTDRDQDGQPFEVQYNDAKGNPIVTTKFKLV